MDSQKPDNDVITIEGNHDNHSRFKELMGHKFRLVDNGLDPDEVSKFLETLNGSSENALERLKHYTSLQKLSVAIQDMEQETQKIVANIKDQAKLEAQKERKAIVDEANRKAESNLAENRKIIAAMRQQSRQEADAEKARIIEEANEKAEAILDETRQFSDTIKQQTQQKAEEDKEKILNEANILAGATLEQAKDTCRIYFDNTKQSLKNTRQSADTILNKYLTLIEDMRAILQQSADNAEELREVTDEWKTGGDEDESHLFTVPEEKKGNNTNAPDTISPSSNEKEIEFEEPAGEANETIEQTIIHGRDQYGVKPPSEPWKEKVWQEYRNEADAAATAVKTTVEQPVAEKIDVPENGTDGVDPSHEERGQRTYNGHLTLVISQREDLTRLEELWEEIEKVPGVHLLLHGGSVGGPIVGKLVLDRPIALIPELEKIACIQHVEEESVAPQAQSKFRRVFGNKNQRPVEPEPRLVVCLSGDDEKAEK